MQNEHSGRTVSVWMATQVVPDFPSLDHNITADVCIVGAGIAGLTTAYHLTREGLSVVVLDDGPIVSGETERTTAHLASALDDYFFELEKLHGLDGARLAAESHSTAIDRIEFIARVEAINCDFTRLDGYLFVPETESTEIIDHELDAARRAGLDVTAVERAPVRTFNTGRALRFANQAQFHPLKYLSGLTRSLIKDGVQLFAHTHAAKIVGGKSPQVETRNGHVISAGSIVVATNTPVNDWVTMHTKQAPYRTYAICARVPSGSVSRALYWDTAEPYHYVRLQTFQDPIDKGQHELLIIGGEDHKTGQVDYPEECFSRLEQWTRERFHVEKIEYRWSGQVMEPVDSLAFIGRNPGEENVYIATGDSGHGMTHGTIAGMLLCDLIVGRSNPWEHLYDPARRSARSIGEFARENLNVARQYGQYLTGGDDTDEMRLPPDTGAIIRRGAKKHAVYCDENGHHHEMSAICPHLGCLVSWNSVEKTWDCPCHGSRFDSYGEVVCGPANQSLDQLKKQPREDQEVVSK